VPRRRFDALALAVALFVAAREPVAGDVAVGRDARIAVGQ